jgi:hypothetical protein
MAASLTGPYVRARSVIAKRYCASIQRPGGSSISPYRRARIQSYAPRPPGWPRQRDGPGSATHESSTLGRKRTSLNGDETLEWMPTRFFKSASMSEDCLPPSRPRKKSAGNNTNGLPPFTIKIRHRRRRAPNLNKLTRDRPASCAHP